MDEKNRKNIENDSSNYNVGLVRVRVLGLGLGCLHFDIHYWLQSRLHFHQHKRCAYRFRKNFSTNRREWFVALSYIQQIWKRRAINGSACQKMQ